MIFCSCIDHDMKMTYVEISGDFDSIAYVSEGFMNFQDVQKLHLRIIVTFSPT